MSASTDGVIDTLEDLFVYLGASDMKFRIDHYSYPVSMIGKTWGKDKIVGYTDGSPFANGVFGHWEVSGVWFHHGIFHAMSAWNVHWSKVSMILNQWRKQDALLGIRGGRASSADFDSYSRFQLVQVNPNGQTVLDYASTYAYRGRGRVLLGNNYSVLNKNFTAEQDPKWLDDGNQLLLSFSAAEPAYWLAKVRMEECLPGLALITDAIGVRELLKFRDIPEGKRRSALLHWVSDHWRKSRVDPESEIFVRKHLRGAEKCTYKNYSIEVKASREDSVEALEAARDRESMRKQTPRRDRRRRGQLQ